MKKIAALLILTLSIISSADQFDDDIVTLLKLTGSQKSVVLIMKQLAVTIRQLNAEIPDTLLQAMTKAISTDNFLQKFVPVYRKYFTHDEVRQFIAFYRSPAGKKLADKTPELTRDGMLIGQEWGRQMAEEIMRNLSAKGYNLEM